MKVWILADDLSGAADCALGFRRAGRRAEVLLHAGAGGGEDIVAIDADTRPLPASAAAERAVAVFKAIHSPGHRLYKKIDSTLRGPWAAEVAALQPLAGLAIVAPAFPSMGRTVRDGHVYVNGQPLEDTATWQLENRGRPAGVGAQLAAAGLRHACLGVQELHASRLAQHASAGVQAVVVDAQSQADLQALARATLELATPFFWVGSGGLSNEIAALLPGSSRAADVHCAKSGPVLTVVGSVSAVSERQCDVLVAHGRMPEVTVAPETLRLGPSHSEWARASQRIAATLDAGLHLVVRIRREPHPDMREAARFAAALASLVAPHFGRIGALIATGGETARAILAQAGIARLRLLEEVEPGVPLSVADAGPCIVTKAGAFGSDEALYHAWQRLVAIQQKQTR